MSRNELRDYFTNRLRWLGVQYPDRTVTELLARVDEYVAARRPLAVDNPTARTEESE